MTVLLRERYEPLEVVGHGGEGRVLRAWDRLHGRTVAVKVRSRVADRQQALAEAKALLTLTPHRLLPVVRDDFFAGDDYFLVMDWVEGVSLDRVLTERSGNALPLDEVVGYLAEVAEALDHLHSHDPPVVHGDVKPANVVVTDGGGAVLVDFGVSRSSSNQGMAHGSPGYAAPEMAGGGATPAVDVFGLAATAYALLTGAPPGPGAQPRWRAVAGARAPQVEVALRRGLAYDPSRRPARASELIAALRGELAGPTNLPASLDSFVGRGRELGELRQRLRSTRLLTLAGPGGVGKTRLATAIGGAVLGEHTDGVYLVELAQVTNPTLVASQAAAALGVSERPGHRLEDTLAAFCAHRRLLLIVDNCEHLVEAAAALVGPLLGAAPHLRVLATSREPLGVAGEVVWRVPPLADAEAVRLFVERAAADRPGLSFGPESAAILERICVRLDRLPLAIELAAARARTLPVTELAARLDDRFRLLRGGSRSAHPRHRTLRAVLDWSHEALSPSEQALFRRLSVFAGSFTLAAVEGICAGDGVDPDDIVEVLGSLVDRSLVLAGEDGRYRLLETLRAYAAERLAEAGEEADVGTRHIGWYEALATARRLPYGPDALQVIDALEAEHDNFGAALRRGIDTGQLEPVVAIASSLAPLWKIRGHHREAGAWLNQLLAAGVDGAAGGTVLRLRTSFGAGAGGLARDREELEAALFLARAAEDHSGVIRTLCRLTTVAAMQGDIPAARRFVADAEAGYKTSHAEGEPRYQLLEVQAIVASHAGEQDRHLVIREAALREAYRIGGPPVIVDALGSLAQASEGVGRRERAKALYEQVLVRASSADFGHWTATASGALGRIAQREGDLRRAAAQYVVALRAAQKTGAQHSAAFWLMHAAWLAASAGDYEAGARMLGTETSYRSELGYTPKPIFQEIAEGTDAAIRDALGNEAVEDARRAAAELPPDEALGDVIAWLEEFAGRDELSGRARPVARSPQG